MKLQLALATALLAVSASAVQAVDTRTPDILGSVSAESVQALSKADASQARGEYYVTGSGSFIPFVDVIPSGGKKGIRANLRG